VTALQRGLCAELEAIGSENRAHLELPRSPAVVFLSEAIADIGDCNLKWAGVYTIRADVVDCSGFFLHERKQANTSSHRERAFGLTFSDSPIRYTLDPGHFYAEMMLDENVDTLRYRRELDESAMKMTPMLGTAVKQNGGIHISKNFRIPGTRGVWHCRYSVVSPGDFRQPAADGGNDGLSSDRAEARAFIVHGSNAAEVFDGGEFPKQVVVVRLDPCRWTAGGVGNVGRAARVEDVVLGNEERV
jgi:hypothetical protein